MSRKHDCLTIVSIQADTRTKPSRPTDVAYLLAISLPCRQGKVVLLPANGDGGVCHDAGYSQAVDRETADL
ncbi:Uncharacterized protein APZ42_004422 [Daphnia magna]|uniref:Uncharacterized protein n=1 Tax=Daphnia magna TaxID=35525 RepID=A0A164H2N7_9CRUS|nr:Uncharacterized protein APZ42_004422 [Daphnia magna]